MLLVLHGPDTYRSRRKLNEIIDEYRQKAGTELNFHRLDFEEQDSAELKRLIETPSLFARKKLVVVEYALAHPTALNTIEPLLAGISDSRDIVIVLWDRELDEKGKQQLVKAEKFANKIQEFKLLSRDALRRWVQDEAKKRGIRLFPVHAAQLEFLRNNLWALSNELDKMAVGELQTTNHKLQTNTTVFNVGDTFFTSRRDGLRNLLHLLRQGHDEHNLFAYLANHARTLFITKLFSERQQAIPASFGIHPYVVKKASAFVRQLSSGHLHSFLHRFFEEDHKIKTGLSRPKESLFQIIFNNKEVGPPEIRKDAHNISTNSNL